MNIFLPYTAIIGKNLWEEENNWQKKKLLNSFEEFPKIDIPETTIIRKWRLGRERCIGNGNIITNRLAADKVWFASLISWCDGNRCKVSGKREFSQRIKQPGSNRNHALPSPQCSVFSYFEQWSYFICVNRSLSMFNFLHITANKAPIGNMVCCHSGIKDFHSGYFRDQTWLKFLSYNITKKDSGNLRINLFR